MSFLQRVKRALGLGATVIPELVEDPSSLEWPEGWGPVPAAQGRALIRELRREMPAGHRLRGLPVYPLGHGEHPDELLFQIEDPDYKFARVHLTWSKERDPQWPWTTLYRTFEDFVTKERAVEES